VPIILQEDIDTIAEAMKCEHEVCGYIDRESGEVLVGSIEHRIDNTDSEDDNRVPEDSDYGYLQIPNMGSRTNHEDTVEFIKTVTNRDLADLLSIAVGQTAGGFDLFNYILSYREYRLDGERWNLFSKRSAKDRVLKWLAIQGFSISS
jgi:hypothetical protein